MLSWFETPLGRARVKQIRRAANNARKKAQSSAPVARKRIQARMYEAARSSRLTASWIAGNTSADAELASSLPLMRARCRQLVRDSSYAKRARTIVINNVIGSGIGMDPQVRTTRGTLAETVNDAIEESWDEWSEGANCHTGGRLAFKLLERVAMAQVFDAGEVFFREHLRPFGQSQIPYALELIEAERIADDLTSPAFVADTGNQVRMGIELDVFFRPVAYYIRRGHPNEVRFNGGPGVWNDLVERVPAEQIIHLATVDRWPQTRGEPWLHTAARRLNDMEGYSESEIVRARGQAVRLGFIKSPESAESWGEKKEDGSIEMEYEAGMITRLNPGEEFTDSAPTAPNPQFDPFMRFLIREIAAGAGVSYESISRDYSQSNYSSSRLALLDDRDLWKFFQAWFICDFRYRVYRRWLSQAVLARAIPGISLEAYALNYRKFEAVLYKPRGWGWIDPTKEVEAYKEAIRAGLTTRTDVIAATAGGQDIEDIDDTRAQELEHAAQKGLEFDTDPDYYMSDAAKAQAEAKAAGKQQPEAVSGNAPPRGRVLGVVK